MVFEGLGRVAGDGEAEIFFHHGISDDSFFFIHRPIPLLALVLVLADEIVHQGQELLRMAQDIYISKNQETGINPFFPFLFFILVFGAVGFVRASFWSRLRDDLFFVWHTLLILVTSNR